MSGATIHVILMEPFFVPTDDCCICDCEVQIWQHHPNFGIPLYEGTPVPAEWEGEWGGFTACKACFDKYERGELAMWTVEQLTWSTRHCAAASAGDAA